MATEARDFKGFRKPADTFGVVWRMHKGVEKVMCHIIVRFTT